MSNVEVTYTGTATDAKSIAQILRMTLPDLAIDDVASLPARPIVAAGVAKAMTSEALDAAGKLPPEMGEGVLDEGEKKDAPNTGVMVALYPPSEVAKELAIEGGEAVEELHVTLAYLGKVEDQPEELDVEQLGEAARSMAGVASPIEGTVGGVGRFSASESSEGRDVFYASVDCPALAAFRESMVAAIQKMGFSIVANHGFTPHMTLAYLATDAPSLAERREPVAVSFPTVSVIWGEERRDYVLGEFREEDKMVEKAVWNVKYMNDLPDSAFLYIESGGKKDEGGMMSPRSLRHFPYKDAEGNVDLPHLRNALARIPQSSLTDDVKAKLTAKATKLLAAEKKKEGMSKDVEATPGKMLALLKSMLRWLVARLPDLSGREDLQKLLDGIEEFDLTSTALPPGEGESIGLVAEEAEIVLSACQKYVPPVAEAFRAALWTAEYALHSIAAEARTVEILARRLGVGKSEEAGMAKRALERPLQVLVKAEDDDDHWVLAIVLEPNDEEAGLKPDLQNEIYSAEEIRKASDYFMEHSREFDYMHRDLIEKGIVLLENWCERAGFAMETPSGSREIRKGTWLQRLGLRDADLYEEIRSGKVTGLSAGGSAAREAA